MLSPDKAVDVAQQLFLLRGGEMQRIELISRYLRGNGDSVYQPRSAKSEYRWLRDRSNVNILALPGRLYTQSLYVDGYRSGKSEEEDLPPWEAWQYNRMDKFQSGIYRAALDYGYSYAMALPGILQLSSTTKDIPAIRPYGPKEATAFYEDPIRDEWPLYFLTTSTIQRGTEMFRRVELVDDEGVHTLVGPFEGEALEYEGTLVHATGFPPVVRYTPTTTLTGEDGSGEGLVKPLIPIQDQINQTQFNMLMAQQYAAFRQRWVTGMAPATDADGNEIDPFEPGVDRMFTSESPDTKFGDFEETNLSGFLEAKKSSIRDALTQAQLPAHIAGDTGNLATAEALSAARDAFEGNTSEFRSSFGESNEQLMRLVAKQMGDVEGWENRSAQVVWRDTSLRSFAATVDALGKMAQMLGVPYEFLWERIPGVTRIDVERMKSISVNRDSELDAAILRATKGVLDADNEGAPNESVPPGTGASVRPARTGAAKNR